MNTHVKFELQGIKEKLAALVLALCLIGAFGLCSCSSSTDADQTSDALSSETSSIVADAQGSGLTFRSDSKLQEHYEKHGQDMGFTSPEDYQAAANEVVADPDALVKTEQEDGDYVFYLEDTNELVIVSTSGYIRTYFCPDNGKSYFDKQ